MSEWYQVENIADIDTPALLVYPDRVQANIETMIATVGDPDRLRPHVKTYKMREIVDMQLAAGIQRFKCATIAEAEMLGWAGAADVLLAYQPVGPKIRRLLRLVEQFPHTRYAALVDNPASAEAISEVFFQQDRSLPVWLDIDAGMHRTGIKADDGALALWQHCEQLPGIEPVGLHVYDGHHRQADLAERTAACEADFQAVLALADRIEQSSGKRPALVAGGSPTFPIHAKRPEVACSPGTGLLWDWGYGKKLAEQDFQFAALVVCRVISHPGEGRLCVDLGHKSVAAENPFPRVHFLNLPDARQVAQSEEHLVLEVDRPEDTPVGTVLYGVPFHICPTCALYEQAFVVRDGRVADRWQVVARDRTLSI